MSINLTKSKGISLEKGLSKVKFTVSWDTKADVDIECLVLKDGKAEDELDFIFYNNTNKDNPEASVRHLGDCRDGSKKDGDNETILVDLTKLESQKNGVLFTASIDRGLEKGQHFGNIGNVICNLIDDSNEKVLATYNVSNDLFGEEVGKLCEIYKDENGKFKYKAVGESVQSLEEFLLAVGLNVE